MRSLLPPESLPSPSGILQSLPRLARHLESPSSPLVPALSRRALDQGWLCGVLRSPQVSAPTHQRLPLTPPRPQSRCSCLCCWPAFRETSHPRSSTLKPSMSTLGLVEALMTAGKGSWRCQRSYWLHWERTETSDLVVYPCLSALLDDSACMGRAAFDVHQRPSTSRMDSGTAARDDDERSPPSKKARLGRGKPARRSRLTPVRSGHPAFSTCRSVFEYERLNHIEEGSYGVVFRARELRGGGIVALKKLKLDEEKNGFPITSLREVMALMVCSHENVVGVREIVVGDTLTQSAHPPPISALHSSSRLTVRPRQDLHRDGFRRA